MIVNVRIDDRLIHGQTAVMWIPHYKVDRVVVVDDDIAKDEIRKSILKMGCPQQCKLSVFTVDAAVDKFKRKIDEGIRVMILTVGPKPILDMIEKGYSINSVTIGNMGDKGNSTFVRKTVFVTADERDAFIEMVDKYNVTLITQMVPSESADSSVIEDIRKVK